MITVSVRIVRAPVQRLATRKVLSTVCSCSKRDARIISFSTARYLHVVHSFSIGRARLRRTLVSPEMPTRLDRKCPSRRGSPPHCRSCPARGHGVNNVEQRRKHSSRASSEEAPIITRVFLFPTSNPRRRRVTLLRCLPDGIAASQQPSICSGTNSAQTAGRRRRVRLDQRAQLAARVEAGRSPGTRTLDRAARVGTTGVLLGWPREGIAVVEAETAVLAKALAGPNDGRKRTLKMAELGEQLGLEHFMVWKCVLRKSWQICVKDVQQNGLDTRNIERPGSGICHVLHRDSFLDEREHTQVLTHGTCSIDWHKLRVRY